MGSNPMLAEHSGCHCLNLLAETKEFSELSALLRLMTNLSGVQCVKGEEKTGKKRRIRKRRHLTELLDLGMKSRGWNYCAAMQCYTSKA